MMLTHLASGMMPCSTSGRCLAGRSSCVPHGLMRVCCLATPHAACSGRAHAPKPHRLASAGSRQTSVSVIANHIQIGERQFQTKREARGFYRGILYRPEAKLPRQLLPLEEQDVLHLLQFHERAAEKLGAGLQHIEVNWAPDRTELGTFTPTCCFWVVRVDGTKTDFSYIKCLDAATRFHTDETDRGGQRWGPSQHSQGPEAWTGPVQWQQPQAIELPRRRDLVHAFRRLVQAQMGKFKSDFFAHEQLVTSSVTGTPILPANYVVVHEEPLNFIALMRGFIATLPGAERPRLLQLQYVDGTPTSLADPEVAQAWQAYHAHHAKLRVVTKAEAMQSSQAGAGAVSSSGSDEDGAAPAAAEEQAPEGRRALRARGRPSVRRGLPPRGAQRVQPEDSL